MYYSIVSYKYDEHLKKLPSKIKYASFDNASDNCKSSTIQTSLMRLKQKNLWIESVYEKIVKALCHVYKIESEERLQTDDCDYLYFWLYDLLYKNITETHLIYTVISTINHILQNNNGKPICDFDKYNNYNIMKENFTDMKTLFDYSKDYDHIQNDLDKHESFCNMDYRNLLLKYAKVYKTIRRNCIPNIKHYSYCSLFITFFRRNNYFLISELSCTPWENKSNITENGKGTHKNIELYEHMVFDEQNLEYKISNIHSASSSSMVAAPIIIGIIVFSIILLKFTPVRYLLKKKLLGNSKRTRNIIMGKNIIEDYSIHEDIESSKRFNVTNSNI
ncbi:variable surface protein [Plasmodium gonderi]|uniref:Variable surface protein n=1 Tax=Plasmodium gonderi TaxID=77519 RepID=A0A1Y1JN96_PLAGO|nr:variable surface protein [Plasmodium gonderi]GAW83959.1 variable surface protein [Plasmodium gonderi]